MRRREYFNLAPLWAAALTNLGLALRKCGCRKLAFRRSLVCDGRSKKDHPPLGDYSQSKCPAKARGVRWAQAARMTTL
jgi:hypothetical protein